MSVLPQWRSRCRNREIRRRRAVLKGDLEYPRCRPYLAEACACQPNGRVWYQAAPQPHHDSLPSWRSMPAVEVAIGCLADDPKTARARPTEGWATTAPMAGSLSLPVTPGHAAAHGEYCTSPSSPDRGRGAHHGASQSECGAALPLTLDNTWSPVHHEPLRRDDICLVSAGGAAVVVMIARCSRTRPKAAVQVLVSPGQTHTRPLRPCSPNDARLLADRFRDGGFRPKDIDIGPSTAATPSR